MAEPCKAFIVRYCFRVDACSEAEAEEAVRNNLCRPNQSTMDSVAAKALPDVRECPRDEWPGEEAHMEPDVACEHKS